MYSLRKITGENVVINIYLGKSYNYIGKLESPKEFERTLNEVFQRLNEDITYAFITDENGKNAYPIYSTQKNYILIEEKIFAYLTENLDNTEKDNPEKENEGYVNPLRCPANHSLQEIFQELKFSRPADSQRYLQKCIDELNKEV